MAADPADPDDRSPVTRALTWLAGLQLRRPWSVLTACLALSIGMAFLATRLSLKTEFAELLPDGQPSVIELRRVLARTTGIAQVFVVLEGDDPAALRELGDRIVPKLVAVGPPWVGSAEDGVQVARSYLMSRAGLFADRKKLEKLREDLDARWDWQVSKQMGTNVDDEAPPAITRASFERAFDDGRRGEIDRFPGGYFQSKDGRALVVVARAAVPAGDLSGSREALARIRAVVEREHGGAAAIRVSYAGDLVTSLLSYGAIKDDLVDVGVLGIGLVLGVILLFYMRIRTLAALGVTIAAGVAWTFGLTQLTIGHLNVATGFLFSIVAGNGINFGIIYQARYLEERRTGASMDDAIVTAHRTTWGATLTAALAAAASYASLGVTDFRGFRHFAVIGAGGMVLCFLATYTLLPAVLVLIERVRPFTRETPGTSWWGRLRANGLAFGTPFARIVGPAPRALAVGGVVLAIVGVLGGVRWLRADPLEYDMRRLENDFGGGPGVLRTSALAREILGVSNESAMVVLCDRLDQVRPLVRALEARRDAAPPGEKPFEAVHTLLDFVPEGQEAKLPTLVAIRNRLTKARARGFVTDADWKDIAEVLPPEDVRPIRVEDLPTELARAFSERDGTRGRLVYIEPTAGKDDNDLRYLLRWADSFRETKLPDGSVVRGSGRAVIFADMLRAVLIDMPKAVVASLALTAFAVAVVFRRGVSTALVIGALAIGVAWLAGLVALLGVKLNFLNFIALPITFGIGVDYAVNLVHRQRAGASALEALRTTGGAVVLCSLTTTLGYLALLGSLNQGVRSLGLVAVLGEVCCLVAAMVVLPAALRWWETRKPR
jgi:hypothetical protein